MESTSRRIKTALALRHMKQAELVEKTGIGKSSISTYISGAYQPKQKNIHKIAKALSVSESWLMGNDVPMEREDFIEQSKRAEKIIEYYDQLNGIGKIEATKRVEELTYLPQYVKESISYAPNAAHTIDGSTAEDQKHDSDIMDSDDF